jgi:predicted Zn-dependent protease
VTAFRRWLLVLIGLLAGTCAQPAEASFQLENATWQNGTTTFNSFLSNGTLTFSTDVALAIADWNNVSGFKFVDTGNSADPCNDNGPNGVAFGSTDCGSAFGSNTLAVTTYTTTGRRLFIHAGIVFNSNVAFSSYNGPMRANPDFRRVALHELGHVLGLDHELDPNIPAIMAPNVSSLYQLQPDDIAGAQFLYGAPAAGQTTVVSAVLPASRSVQVNAAATAFATIVNAGTQAGTGCSIGLASQIAANFSYQTTSAATNQAVGSPNTPASIPVNGSQSFIISVTPTAFLNPTNVAFTMQCSNAPAASSTVGLNTLLLSASNAPTPDIVALAATAQNDGYVHVGTGSGAFALATVNLGAAATLAVSADTGTTSLPALTLTLCQTNPSTGQCITPIGASVQSVINTNETPTFSIFVNSTASISPDPANRRIFVRFRDSGGATRGSTSVAVTSQ